MESETLTHHALLLQAALLDGDRARGAFAAWTACATGRLDSGSTRLLPLLHLNLRAVGMAEAEEPRLVDAFARASAGTTLLAKAVASVVHAFDDAGISCAVLKGLPLAFGYYPAPGARPMGDGDLLVRPAEAPAAGAVLERCGWRPDAKLEAGVIATAHAMRFTHATGQLVDLHWHVQAESAGTDADEDVWAAMEPIDIGGAATRMPCPTDILLHVCVHGMRWSTTPPVRWAADAVMVLRTAGHRVDWGRLVDRSARQRVVLAMRDALGFLRETLEAPVPPDVIDRLSGIRVLRADRLEHGVKQRPRTPARLAILHWLQHRRLSKGTLPGDLVRFPRYLKHVWGLRPR